MKKTTDIRSKTAKFAISELFTSIQGESSFTGKFCFFIRLAGCNLNCSWCDTEYARKTRHLMSLPEILDYALSSGAKIVGITGGEPLEQEQTPLLCKKLLENNFDVLLETNGSIPIEKIPTGVKIILDCKCPSSGESSKMLFANFAKIKKKDEIKFVIADREDYEYAKKIIDKYKLYDKTKKIFFSPVTKKLKYKRLAEWMMEDNSQAIFSIQLHKIIWGEDAKGR